MSYPGFVVRVGWRVPSGSVKRNKRMSEDLGGHSCGDKGGGRDNAHRTERK